MKKILSILIAIISTICIAFAFVGCGEESGEQDNEANGGNQSQGTDIVVDGDETQTDEQGEAGSGEKIEVRGQFYNLKQAYDNGWLGEDDLKSIACLYYDDLSNYYDNPYSGLFDPHEELKVEIANEIKQAYLVKTVKDPELSIDGVHISQYYGTYNGNTAVFIMCDYINIDIDASEDVYIGGVFFKNYWLGQILVYHFQ